MRRGPWKFQRKLRSASPTVVPSSQSCATSGLRCWRLPCFPDEDFEPAPRDAPPTPAAKTGAPPPDHQDHGRQTTQQPNKLMPVLWQHEWAHGCSSCGCSTGTSRPSDVPPTLSSELGACWKYSSWSPSWELLDRCIFGTSVGQTDNRTMSVLSVSVRRIPVSRTEQGIRNLVRGKNERSG